MANDQVVVVVAATAISNDSGDDDAEKNRIFVTYSFCLLLL